jgi:spore maturation protein CgeB
MPRDGGPRILVVGDFRWTIYERSFCDALRRIGAEPIELPVWNLFGPGDLLRRAQTKYCAGPGVAAANLALIAACIRHKPDLVLAWRTPWLAPWAIKAARSAGARRLVLYNNDDPFGQDAEMWIWRRFRKLIPHADACFVYRQVNLEEYMRAGAKAAGLLRSYFDPAVHRPVEVRENDRKRFETDVVFVGHCEPDGRLAMIDRLIDAGVRLRLFGTGWETHASGHRWQDRLPIVALRDEDYVRAIAASRIALVFLSHRNRDTYTRRCFEIPAIGTLMLAPRTPDLLTLYREDEEAAFFDSADELIAQVRRYLADPEGCQRVAAAGRNRALRDGHDVDSRARRFLVDLGFGGRIVT